ncbi:MAG: YajQ family cyclic di-GMP-binding protein [SAR324 cluster bacterium]|nr:YajQ family cyclic di-GMP-binding protein [SAR324 cluster bacterium]
MANPSFDIVSQVDLQEVTNAVDQAKREIQNRYDFKGTTSEISIDKTALSIRLVADDEMTLDKIIDVLLTKLLKRAVPVKSMVYGSTEHSGKVVRKDISIQQGISKDNCKKITQFIKKTNLKVQAQIMDEQVRVSGKKKDDLQSVMAQLKDEDFEFDIQFVNYR